MIALVTIAIIIASVSFILVVTSTVIYAKKSISIQNDYNSKIEKVLSEMKIDDKNDTYYNTKQDNNISQTNQTLQNVQGSYVKQADLNRSITTGSIKASSISASENINTIGNITGNNASVNNLTASNLTAGMLNTNSVNITNTSYGPWISQNNSGIGTSNEGLQLYSKSGSSINLGFNNGTGYNNALTIDESKNTKLNGKLSVLGESSLDSLNISKKLNVNGNSSLLGNLNINGISTFESPATFKSSAAFLEPSTFDKNITVKGTSTFNGSSVFSSPVSVKAPATFSNNISVLGSSLFENTSTFNKNAIFNSPVSVKAPATFSNNISVLGSSTFNGSSVFSSPVSVEAPATFSNNISVLGSSLFGNTSTFNKNAIFNNDISIKGNIVTEGTETISALTAPVNQEWFPINKANEKNMKNQGVLIYNGAAIISGGGLSIGSSNKIAEGSLYVRDKVNIAHNSNTAPFDTSILSAIKPNDSKTVGSVLGGPDQFSYLPNKDGHTYINPGKNNGYVSVGLDPITNRYDKTSQLNVYPPTAFVNKTYNFESQSMFLKNPTEYGYGIAKEVNAGKIGYKTFSDSLDIVGAGTVAGNRNVKVWDNLETGGKITMNDNLLSLRGMSDSNHGLKYSSDVNGPSLFGSGGGKLSTTFNGDVVKWDNNGNVKILGSLQICDKNGNSCRNL